MVSLVCLKEEFTTTGDITIMAKQFFKHVLITDQVSAVGDGTKIYLDSLNY